MTSPSTYYRQHRIVEAPRVDRASFRTAWRVSTRLDQLLDDKAITMNEWGVAVRLRTAVETVALRQGIRSSRVEYMPRSGNSNFTPVASASKHCREVEQYFGPIGYAILTACIVDDLAWAELGRRMKRDHRTARSHVIALLKMLGQKFP